MNWIYGGLLSLILALGIYSFWPPAERLPVQLVFGAGGDNIFNDTFTDANNTLLSAHTPDTGSAWSLVFQSGGSACSDNPTLDIDSNTLGPGCLDATSAGATYLASTTYPSADYQVQFTCTDCGSSDEHLNTVIRSTATFDEKNGAYLLGRITTDTTDSPALFLVTDANQCFEADSLDQGTTLQPAAIFPDNTVVTLQAIGNEIVGFANQTGWLYISTTTISAAGFGGAGMGATPCISGSDMGASSEDDSQKIDGFSVVEIADSATSYAAPTATGAVVNGWTTPTNAYSDDGNYAEEDDPGDSQYYGDFGFSVPAGSTIRGIQFLIEGETGAGGNWVEIGVNVSNDAGATWSATSTGIWSSDLPDIYVFGHANYLWGLTWTVDDTANSDFRVKLTHTREESSTAGRDLEVDYIQAKIFYDAGAATTQTTYDANSAWFEVF